MPVTCQEMELLSRQIDRAHRAAVQGRLEAAGLGEIGHPMLLSILKSGHGDERGPAQRDLAELLHISPAAVANSLKSLEKGGYIHREPGADDARCNRVRLTEKGRRAVDCCDAVFEAVSQRMLAGFSEEEKGLLLSFRRRMLNNLRPAQTKEVDQTCFPCL